MLEPRSRRAFVVGLVALMVTAGLLPGVASGANQPGALRAWGLNIYGQLGDGTTTAHGPAPVSGLSDVTDLHGGRGHVVALRANGTVVAWGDNEYGQVGDGTVTARSLPTPVPGLTGAVEVATGHYHSMALLSAGTVRTWGYNAYGQLGDGSTTSRRSPVTVSGLTGVTHIAGGRDMSYAVRSDGTVWAWGLNTDGEIGDGTTTTRLTPVRVGTLTGVTAIAGGRDHGLAVLSNGTVWAWGDNAYGQIGDGTLTDRRSPVQVSGLSNITMVGAGAHHSYALRSDGALFSWGRNNLGQLGDGSTTGRRTPVPVSGLGSSVVFVGSGRDHGLAVMSNGSVRAWGRNDFRQLGDGTTTNRTTPIVVPGISGAEEAHGGQDYSMALVATGPPDTTPPTQPGTPTGVSNSTSTISLTWAAADDDVSSSLRYDVYRDGAAAGSVTSASTTTVSFTDTGLAAGSTHTYHVIAVDAQSNASAASDESAQIVVQSPVPDTTPPTQPGTPTGVSNSTSTISLTWAAADDDVSSSLRYDVYRDGAAAGSVTSASTTTVSFTDTGLAAGSTHTYHVIAVDASSNASAASDESAQIVVQSVPTLIFSDDFSSGGFTNWTSVTRLTIDAASGNPTAPSARGAPSSQTAFATKTLGATYPMACLAMDVNATSRSGIVVLGRMRTAADGPIARVLVNASGILAIKSDVSGVTRTSTTALGAGWHRLELCGTVGTAGTWDLYRDGVRIVNSWVADTGTLGIGRINIGDTSATTWTINFDRVVVDQTPG